MKVQAVCIGKTLILEGKKSKKTGIYKAAFDGSLDATVEGMAGDTIIDRKFHGGPDQAIYLEGSIDLDWWSLQLGRTIEPGTFGENLVIEGLDNRLLAAGDRLEIGDVLLEVTSARIPCSTFSAKMGDPKFAKLYTQACRPGAYCRVLKTGSLESGQPVKVMAYAGERIGLPEMMKTYGRKLVGADLSRYLAAPISERLRAKLTRS